MRAHADNQLATSHRPRWAGLVAAVCALVTCAAVVTVVAGRGPYGTGSLEQEIQSDFSTIRVRRQGDVRTLLFLEKNGGEVIESQVDLEEPHRLLLPYTRTMFVSYLFVSEQRRALIVGLGGGAMVHFLQHFDPQLDLDVVEIDPAIIQVADRYFGVRGHGNVRIINQDARQFLQDDGRSYDVIYMDAFLGASDATDATGVPLHLKSVRFFQQLQRRLSPDGTVVFNLHRHRNHEEDVRAIRAAFPHAYIFGVPARGNVIVAASMVEVRLDRQTLLRRAAELDRTSRAGFSFRRLVESLVD